MPFSRYISRQSSNTIYLVTGTTYLFDVDTPENGGLKSTTPSVKDLLSDLSRNSLIGSILTPGGLTKKRRYDCFRGSVTGSFQRRDGKKYLIDLRREALKGMLHIEHEQRTFDTKEDLVINYTTGQRSPNTTIVITLPRGLQQVPVISSSILSVAEKYCFSSWSSSLLEEPAAVILSPKQDPRKFQKMEGKLL
ncbi:hypothetical protein KRR40_46900 [Niabella defluvii]|nr:hypothetical protein KRR40_46900 [Niabella sp. I65]